MKFMNNHYGQSMIFGKKVRFATEPSGEAGNGIGDNGTAGGASGSDEGGSDESGDNGGSDELSIEELKLQLAKERAEKERFKSSVDNLAKKNKELTDKTRKYMTDEQKAQADKEARDQELEDLKREVRMSKYSKRLVGIGMAESDADELAGIIPELGDNSDSFFDGLGKFIEAVKKTAGEAAVQKLLKDRPDINAGNGGGISIAEEKAQTIGKRNANRTSENKITDYYKR